MTKLLRIGGIAKAVVDVGVRTALMTIYMTAVVVIMTMIGIGIEIGSYSVHGVPFGANSGRHSTICHTKELKFHETTVKVNTHESRTR